MPPMPLQLSMWPKALLPEFCPGYYFVAKPKNSVKNAVFFALNLVKWTLGYSGKKATTTNRKFVRYMPKV